jgi:hypothetical protein
MKNSRDRSDEFAGVMRLARQDVIDLHADFARILVELRGLTLPG